MLIAVEIVYTQWEKKKGNKKTRRIKLNIRHPLTRGGMIGEGEELSIFNQNEFGELRILFGNDTDYEKILVQFHVLCF